MEKNRLLDDNRKLFDVVGVGCHAVDLLCMVDRYPVEDEKIEVDFIEMQGGGNIATALVAVTRLGGKAAFQGVVGNDQYRDRVISDLKKEGVDTGCIKVKEGNNPLAFIMINRASSTRTIIYTRKGTPAFNSEDIDGSVIKLGKVLLIDFYYPEASLKASEIARDSGIPVVVDAERKCELASEIMRNATHIIASRSFAEWFTGYGVKEEHRKLLMKFYKKAKSDFVCITLGSEGAIGYDGSSHTVFHQEAFRVDVVDTTGAGDVFHGAFAFFLARGYSLQDALIYSSACAAIKCRSIGGRRGIPSFEEVKIFVRDSGS